MIEYLSLSDFQAHASSKLSLVPGLNVIIGRNDSGKSSILRALQWVLFDRPSGDRVRRLGSTNTEVEIGFPGVGSVIRQRSSSGMGYSVALDGKVEQYKGAKPPEVIGQIFPLDSYNVSNFTEPLFLILSSGGELSKRLGEVVQIGVLTDAIKKIKDWIRDDEKQIKASRVEADQCQVVLLSLPDLAQAESWLDGSRTLVATLDSTILDLRQLSSWGRELTESIRSFCLFSDLEKELLPLVLEAEASLSVVTSSSVDMEVLERATRSLEESKRSITQATKEVFVLSSAITNLDETALSLERLYSLLESLSTERAALGELLSSLSAFYTEISRMDRLILILVTSLSDLGKILENSELLCAELRDVEYTSSGLLEAKTQMEEYESQMLVLEKGVADAESALSEAVSAYEEELKTLKTCPLCLRKMSASAVSKMVQEVAG